MKILVAHLTAECNQHIKQVVSLNDFEIYYDQQCIEEMHIKQTFEQANIEVIPSIYASINPNGMIAKDAFDFIANRILEDVMQYRLQIDGIYLQLHGASAVLDLDEISGELYIMKKIRAIVGQHMPIALVMDPHGNLTNQLGSLANIVRCCRESPHDDYEDTEIMVAKLLIDLVNNRRPITPIILKLPIMVGGERSVSAKEPIKTINDLLNLAEQQPYVLSASYHVGYIRHDDDSLGAAVTIIPTDDKYHKKCLILAKEIANYAWDNRHQFKFSGNFEEPQIAVEKALAYNDKIVVITDSGDNCGAGGAGHNTIILNYILQYHSSKKILIAGINDAIANHFLSQYPLNSEVHFNLGINENSQTKAIAIQGKIVAIGQQIHGFGSKKRLGPCFTVNIKNTNIDVIVCNKNIQFGTMPQYAAADINFHDYDIVVVKMGYLDTYLIPETKYHIMALTDGPTIQRSERLNYKLIYRPMWPIDDIDKLTYIK